CELHKILLDSVRGQSKAPGQFRIDQNWIGKAGCSIEQASFVPPAPLQLPNFLQAWEAYMDFDDSDFLLQAAVVHAQFELLHPFKDGNGRIGRILIPLFLYQKKALSEPMFYLSEYLEANRDEYYQGLKGISEQGDWNTWIAFFLKAISVQAKQNSLRVRAIMALYEEMKITIQDITHSQYAVHLLDALFNKPIFKTSDLVKQLKQTYGIHEKTTPGLLRQLKEAGILRELQVGSGRRAAVLCFPRLINLAEGKDVL
ncbi:MAG: Fic family protein, partial [Gammaproteobacteria bacterium]|nr:Fic family protein [Gammaproteobacteria bacterium]